MTTYNHTPIVNGDSRGNDAAIWNDPLGDLDAAIGNLTTTGVSGASAAAQLATTKNRIDNLSVADSGTEVGAARNAGLTDGTIASLSARLGYAAANAYHPMAYSATGDGATNDYTALNAIKTTVGSSETHMIIDRAYAVGTNLTLPSNLAIVFARGGKFTVGSGVTLTLDGPIEAGPWQIFDGDGAIDFDTGVQSRFRPEWWGAVGDASANNATPTDDTAALQAMLDATPRGSDYIIERMYATTGIVVGLNNADCSFTGKNKGRTKAAPQTRYVSGFCAYDDQDYIIKVGDTATGQIVGVQFKDLYFWGDDKLMDNAMLWLSHLSQGSVQSCTFAFSKGPAMQWDKLEDFTITDCNLWEIGSNTTPGVILINYRDGDSFSNNLIRVHNCRFERFTGGAFRMTDDGIALVVHVSLCKFEMSAQSQYETTTATNTENNAVFQLRHTRDSTDFCSNWRVSECQFTNPGDTAFANKLMWVTGCDTFVFESNTITTKNVALTLFHLEQYSGNAVTSTARNFIFRDNTVRNATGTFSTWALNITNESSYPIVYELPRSYIQSWTYIGTPSNPVNRFISAHDIASGGILVVDPANDSLDPRKTVIARTQTNPATNATFANLFTETPCPRGYHPDYGESTSSFTFKVRVRAKKLNSGDAFLLLHDGTSVLATTTINSTSWKWFTMKTDLNLGTGVAGGVRILNSTSTAEGNTIYIDGFTIEPAEILPSSSAIRCIPNLCNAALRSAQRFSFDGGWQCSKKSDSICSTPPRHGGYVADTHVHVSLYGYGRAIVPR